jgi:hypothetical protein
VAAVTPSSPLVHGNGGGGTIITPSFTATVATATPPSVPLFTPLPPLPLNFILFYFITVIICIIIIYIVRNSRVAHPGYG